MSSETEKAIEASRASALYQLDMCCESACDKLDVRQYIQYLEFKITVLEQQINKESKDGY